MLGVMLMGLIEGNNMKIEKILYGILNAMIIAFIIGIATVSHFDTKDHNEKLLDEIAKTNAALIESTKKKVNKCSK